MYNNFKKIIRKIIREEIEKNFFYKKKEIEDGIIIEVIDKNRIIGNINFEIIYEPYQYEFSDDFSYEEFENIFGDIDELVKLSYLMIKPDHRFQGIGKKLMEIGIKEIKNKGYNQIYLNASPMDIDIYLESLIDFYKSFGFKIILHQGNNALMLLKL